MSLLTSDPTVTPEKLMTKEITEMLKHLCKDAQLNRLVVDEVLSPVNWMQKGENLPLFLLGPLHIGSFRSARYRNHIRISLTLNAPRNGAMISGKSTVCLAAFAIVSRMFPSRP